MAPLREDVSAAGNDIFERDSDRGAHGWCDPDGPDGGDGGEDRDNDNLGGFLYAVRGRDLVLSCCDGRSLFLPGPTAPTRWNDSRRFHRRYLLWESMEV